MAGGAALGVRLYYLIGLAMGAVFGAAAVRLKLLRGASLWQDGLAGHPVCGSAEPAAAGGGHLRLEHGLRDAALWLAISAVMHMVYGIVLGSSRILGVRERAGKGTNEHGNAHANTNNGAAGELGIPPAGLYQPAAHGSLRADGDAHHPGRNRAG